MTDPKKQFEFTKQLEHLLASLSNLYARNGASEKLELVVNGVPQVEEGWSFDNWNGGTYGHAVHLAVPASCFPMVAEEKDRLEEEIKTDINNIFNVQNEFVHRVFIEMVIAEDEDWRQKSGVLAPLRPSVPSTTLSRIWGTTGFRLFLSHKAEAKIEAAELKAQLRGLAVSAFVAHEDIHPNKVWQDEIESALASMDGFVAVMTEAFHDSYWTDQEVGYAVARGVPIIAVRLGRDPYGFIGKFQALSCSMEEAPRKIVKLLLKHPRMLDAYVAAVEDCKSWEEANVFAELLPDIDRLDSARIGRLVTAFNTNASVSGSWGFNGTYVSKHGQGLAVHLKRLTGLAHVISEDTIKVVP